MWSLATMAVSVQGYRSRRPNTSGTKNSAIQGSVRAAASKMRRRTTPQPPPDRCCSIVKREPAEGGGEPEEIGQQIGMEELAGAHEGPGGGREGPMTPMMSDRWRSASRLAGGV